MDGERVTSPFLLADDDLLVLNRMSDALAHEQRTLQHLDLYYTGSQPLRFLAPEVEAQVGARLTSLVINWPRTIVDSVQRRTSVEGFRLGSGGAADDELWRLWQENDLDAWSHLAHVDALVHGRSFLMVWAGEDPATPSITVESSHQVTVEFEPAPARRVRHALKQYVDGNTVFAVLMFRDRVLRFERRASTLGVANLAVPSSLTPARWELVEVLPNPLGAVPVVPLVNRPRVLNFNGESELTDVIPMSDAVNKLATDLLVASEYSAMPRRWATGLQIPTGPDRERLQAEASAYWDQATKGKTWLAGPDVQFGQFPEASLTSFTDAIKLLTAQIAAISGLPPHYLGINTDNPASADAIRSAEATLNERAREKMKSWGDSYERAMRLAVAVRDGIPLAQIPAGLRSMETVWRDPETRTKAQDADAAVKLHAAKIIDDVQAQEDVGLSPMQRRAIAERRAEAVSTAATADVEARLNLADQLVAEKGMTYNAALSAVGLLQAAATNSAESA